MPLARVATKDELGQWLMEIATMLHNGFSGEPWQLKELWPLGNPNDRPAITGSCIAFLKALIWGLEATVVVLLDDESKLMGFSIGGRLPSREIIEAATLKDFAEVGDFYVAALVNSPNAKTRQGLRTLCRETLKSARNSGANRVCARSHPKLQKLERLMLKNGFEKTGQIEMNGPRVVFSKAL